MSRIVFLIRSAVSLGLLVLFVWFVGFVWFISQVERLQVPADPRADGIVVLTGGGGRVEEGLKLLTDGRAGKLLISGVHREVTLSDLLPTGGSQTVSDTLRNCCISLGYEAGTTYGNAVEAASWAREEKFKSLIVVTAHYHLPRALIEFHRALPGVELLPYPLARGNVAVDHWWDAPATTRLLAVEYTKYGGALLRTATALARNWIRQSS